MKRHQPVGGSGHSAIPASNFFRLVLPALACVNLALGLVILLSVAPRTWTGLMQVATGAFCCAVASWLFSAGWSKAYWGRTIERQVDYWQRVADVMFRWVEDASVPLESLNRLHSSLRDVRSEP